MNLHSISYILVPLLATLLTAGCSPSSAPVVTVSNRSSLLLTNIVLSGAGFSERVGSIGAGREKKVTVHPQGNTGLRVAFDAGARHVDSGQQSFFRSNDCYLVSAMIKTDLAVSVTTRSCVPEQPKNGEPGLRIVNYRKEGDQRLVTFEFSVPSGKRFWVTRTQLVIEHGTATEMHGTPAWVKQSDPSGKVYGAGTKSFLCIVEPKGRLLRLQLEGMLADTGMSTWGWKLRRCWRTKSISALKETPPPRAFFTVQSDLISSYRDELESAADQTQRFRSQ